MIWGHRLQSAPRDRGGAGLQEMGGWAGGDTGAPLCLQLKGCKVSLAAALQSLGKAALGQQVRDLIRVPAFNQ